MIRIFKVKPDHDNIRVDRWFKINISKIPQSLIQKFLRLGKIKVNKKKLKIIIDYIKMIKFIYMTSI